MKVGTWDGELRVLRPDNAFLPGVVRDVWCRGNCLVTLEINRLWRELCPGERRRGQNVQWGEGLCDSAPVLRQTDYLGHKGQGCRLPAGVPKCNVSSKVVSGTLSS